MLEQSTQDQELFGILASSSPAGIFILQEGKFQFVNKQFQMQTGYSEEELLGTASLDLVVPEDRAKVKQDATRMLKGERSLPYEYRVIYKGGTSRWNLETVSPIQYKGYRGAIGSFTDITELKHTEELLRNALDETAHNHRLLLAFSHAAKAVHRAISSDEIYQTAVREMSRIGYYTAILSLTDDRKHLTISCMSRPSSAAGTAERAIDSQLRRSRLRLGSFLRRVVAEQTTIFAADFGQEIGENRPEQDREAEHRFAEFLGADQVICSPITVHGEACGILCVAGQDLSQADEPAIDVFAIQISTAIEKALLIQKVQERATTDGLTGLYNRRHFYDLLETEAGRAARSGKPLSLIMLGIDDSGGQQGADALLKGLSTILRRAVRPTDVLARYGGEEFAIILPETSYEEATVVAERACQMVEGHEFKIDADAVRLKLNAGVATNEAGRSESAEDLIKRAETAFHP